MAVLCLPLWAAAASACTVNKAEIYTSQVQDVITLSMKPLAYPRVEPVEDPYKRVILFEGCQARERVLEDLKNIRTHLIHKIEPYHWEGLGELFQVIIYLKKPVDLVAAEEGGAITFTLKNREFVPVPFAPHGPGPKRDLTNLDVIELIEDTSRPQEATPAPNWLQPGGTLERSFGGQPARNGQQPQAGGVTLHHDSAPLDKVLEDLAKQSGLNLVLDKEALATDPKGVTVHMTGVPAREALDSILASQGLDSLKKGRVTVVTSPERAMQDKGEGPAGGEQVAYFPVNYVDPVELVNMIRRTPLKPAPLNVEAFDARGPVNDNTVLNNQEGLQEIRFRRDLVDAGRKGAIVSYGTPAANRGVDSFIKKVDLAPHQVVLEVTVYELTNTDLSEFGIGQNRTNPVTGVNQKGMDAQSGALNTFFEQLATGGGGLSIFYDRGNNLKQDFRAIMRMLIEKGKARILNRPTLATLDGQPAVIRVGDEEPIVRRDPTKYTSNDFTSRVDYRLIGMSLYVVPRVDSKGNVVLAVNPVLTDKKGDSQIFNSDGSVNVSAPVISVREANTVVHVKSGEKVLIGGLMRQVQQETTNRVPVLSKLPLVGKLFQNESKDFIKQEILIEITPRVVKDLTPGVTPTSLPSHREKIGR